MPDDSTHEGWKKLFSNLNIKQQLQENGICTITADEIKQNTGREPRLMTKFDTRESRPPILQQNSTTILPLQNGVYALIKCDGYADFEVVTSLNQYQPKNTVETVTIPWSSEFSSESQVLDAAHISSILRTFTGEHTLYLTIRGRLRSPNFDFSIQDNRVHTHQIKVSGVQIEVDGGYEGNQVYLIEAKMGSRSNFIKRQLYYPFRMWNDVGGKRAIPILLTYSNKVFSLRQYEFKAPDQYDSISLQSAKDYVFSDNVEPPDLHKIFESTPIAPARIGIPFPQADDLGKVVDLTEAVFYNITGKEELAERFEFDPRQADYYGNAAAYLGLIDRSNVGFKSNPSTNAFVPKSRNGRIQELVRRISGQAVFHEVVEHELSRQPLSRERIAQLILEKIPSVTTEATALRRAKSVESWIAWLIKESSRML